MNEQYQLPTFDQMATPVLRLLSMAPDGLSKASLREALATELKLDESALRLELTSGQTVFDNRSGWACSWLKACGWADNPRRAWWSITPEGLARLKTGIPITAGEMRPISRSRRPQRQDEDSIRRDAHFTDVAETGLDATIEESATPHERIADAVAEIKQEVETDVLQRLSAGSPLFFERSVLRLLEAMGYAGELGASQHSGKTADGGIDGILYLDRLHLERVYVQAKRWKESVSSSVVRDFAGAMDAEAATKGVILATSGFTREAHSYVERSPKAIRLVDGPEVARLMVEFGVGVSRTDVVVLPRIDEDYFEPI